MNKRKILIGVLLGALGIGAYFGLKEKCNPPKEKPKVIKKVQKKRRYAPRQRSLDFNKMFLDSLRKPQDNTIPDAFERSMNMCAQEKDWEGEAKLLALDGDYQEAIDMYKEHSYTDEYGGARELVKAADIAFNAGDEKQSMLLLLDALNLDVGWYDDIAKGFAKLGEDDLALFSYEKLTHPADTEVHEVIKIAKRTDKTDIARHIMATALKAQWGSSENQKRLTHYYRIVKDNYPIPDLEELGYYELFKSRCQEMGEEFINNLGEVKKGREEIDKKGFSQNAYLGYMILYDICWGKILKHENRWRELVEFEFARPNNNSPIAAVVAAEKYGIPLEDIEIRGDWPTENIDELIDMELKHNIEKRKYVDTDTIKNALELGYYDRMVELAEKHKKLEALVCIEKEAGNVESALDAYERLAEEKPVKSYEAAEYAKKHGKRDDERFFLDYFLKNKHKIKVCDDCWYRQGEIDEKTAYALAKLGREEEAIKFCESLKHNKCSCANLVMKTLYSE